MANVFTRAAYVRHREEIGKGDGCDNAGQIHKKPERDERGIGGRKISDEV